MKFGLLKVTTADGRTREYPIDLPSLVVGRADGNSIVIDDLSVARRHARLSVDSGRLMVEDLGSSTGTFIAGQRIPPNSPSLVENAQDMRFGDVGVRYQAPEALADAPGGGPGEDAAAAAARELSADMPANIRATLSVPPQPIEAGGSPAIAYLAIQNRGRVVDELSISVLDLPADWVRMSQPKLILLPGDQTEVTLLVQPPRRSESHAGVYDFSVVVTSGETGREVLTSAQVEVLPFDATTVSLHPVRSKKHFGLVVENQGNALSTYRLSATDDEEAFIYQFDSPTVELAPGQQLTTAVHITPRKRKYFGPNVTAPFSVMATPVADPEGTKPTAMGQLAIRPPLQKFVRPAALTALAAILAVAVYFYFFGPSGKGPQTANAEAAYSGVHMCDKAKADQPKVPTGSAASSAAPLFAQIDPSWAQDEYAKAKDPEFGPDWCGTTIQECGCAMTSVTTIMALFQVLTMPDGSELTPKTVNEWFNLNARKTSKGWVSQGYVYGDVVWTAVNQLSGEIAKVKPGTRTLRFARVGTGQDEEVRTELKAGRPVILEVPGHWIAAYGLDGDKILINDPYYRDRKTLDAYAGKVKSSVLFEASSDLSAVVITAPSNVRVRVTDKEGRVVGSLNTGTPETAKKEAQQGIPGSSYSYRAAWRDPTCVESPPPAGAGTNQIILPGAKDDYKIEVLDAGGGPTSVAIHTYDKTGASAVQTADNPGPVVLDVAYDPLQASASVNVVPGATPTADTSQPSPAGGANGVPAGGTPTKSATATATGSATAAPTSTPTASPTPAAPTNVTVACTTAYNSAPKSAVVSCNATIDGTFTNANWTVNGVTLPSAAGKATASTTFDANANAVMSITACNVTACRSGSSSVSVAFPSATPTASPTPTPTGTTPTPTPAVPVQSANVSCAVNGGNVSCSISFTGDYTSIAWSSPKGSPPDASAGSKTYSFSAFTAFGDGDYTLTINGVQTGSLHDWDAPGTIQSVVNAAFPGAGVTYNAAQKIFEIPVGATVCNGPACQDPVIVQVHVTAPVVPSETPPPDPTSCPSCQVSVPQP